MKHYFLQHKHNNDWWGVCEITEQALNNILESGYAEDIIRTKYEISFRLPKMFHEPLFRVVIVERKED